MPGRSDSEDMLELQLRVNKQLWRVGDGRRKTASGERAKQTSFIYGCDAS